MRIRNALISLAGSFYLVASIGCSRGPGYYLERGNKFFSGGKYEDAAIQYRKALQKDPGFGEALYRLGLTEVERNAFSQAYPLLFRAAQAMPQSDEVRVKLAETALAIYVSSSTRPRAMYDQIETISDELLAKDPHSFDGWRFAGSLRLLDQRPEEAIQAFEKANQIKPMQHDLIVGLSQALFLDNQFPRGERLALDLIRKEPTFGPIYDVLYRQYLGANRLADAENILALKAGNNPTQADYLVELAEHYARNKKPTEMAATLQRLIDHPKEFPQGALKAGDFYAKIGNGPEAIHQFEEGARKNPKEKLIYQKRIVDVLLLEGKRDEAATLVDSMLKENAKDLDARRVHATLRMERGKPEDVSAAIQEFTALVKDAPNDPVLRFNFGRAWLAQRDFEKARVEFQEAVRARGDYVPGLYALTVVSLQLQKPGDALGYVQNLLAYEPNNIGAKLLGIASLTALGRYADAHTELGYLLTEFPNRLDVQLQAGFLAIAEKKYKDAERVFQRFSKSGQNDSRSAVGMAELYSAQDQFDNALQLLNQELKKSPDSPSLLSLTAFIATRAGNYNQAISAYQKLLSREPQSAELHGRLGMIYEATGNHNAAIASLQEANRLAPGKFESTILLGISLDRARRSEEAKGYYQRALQMHPDDATALNNLSYLLAQTGGNLDEALRLVQRALQKSPGQPNYTDTLGYIYLKKKMNESAVRTFQSLVRQYPKNSVFHYHLGIALLEGGDKVGAKAELQSALANQPSQEDERSVRDLLSTIRG